MSQGVDSGQPTHRQRPGLERFSVAVFPCLNHPEHGIAGSGTLFAGHLQNAVLFGSEVVVFPHVRFSSGSLSIPTLRAYDLHELLESQGVPWADGAALFWDQYLARLILHKGELDEFFERMEAEAPGTLPQLENDKNELKAWLEIVTASHKGINLSMPSIGLGEDDFWNIAFPVLRLRDAITERDRMQYALRLCDAILQTEKQPLPNLQWEPLQALAELELALQRVCLPDLSHLPLGEVMHVRDSTEHLLDPVRGELLRLTEVLRKPAHAEWGEGVQREAAHLIDTRIVPLVLEASSFIESEMGKKRRRLALAIGKYVAVVGLGFLVADPTKIITKGIELAAETARAASDVYMGAPLPAKTAQFVLEVDRLVSDVKQT